MQTDSLNSKSLGVRGGLEPFFKPRPKSDSLNISLDHLSVEYINRVLRLSAHENGVRRLAQPLNNDLNRRDRLPRPSAPLHDSDHLSGAKFDCVILLAI